MSSRSKLTSLNVSNTLTCVLQPFDACWHTQHLYWQPALTCVLQRAHLYYIVSLSHWQPALTCVLQQTRAKSRKRNFYWQPALTCVLQLHFNSFLPILSGWQPALTCVLQPQKCTILQHAEFVNAGLFVHGYLLSLGLKKSRRVSTEYRSEKHFLLRILSAKIRVCIS